MSSKSVADASLEEKRQAGSHPDSVRTRQGVVYQDISFQRTHRILGALEKITSSQSSIEHGGTSALFNFMALLTLLKEIWYIGLKRYGV